jgi:hypothetical protein
MRLSANVQARAHMNVHMLWNAHTDPHAQTRTGMRRHTTRSRAHRSRGGRAPPRTEGPCARMHTAAAPPSPHLATCLHVSCCPEPAWRLTAWRLTADGALQERRKLQDARACQWRPRGRREWRSVRRCQAHMHPQRSFSGAGLRWTVRHCPERDPEPPLEAGAGPSRENDCEPQFTVKLGQGEMRLRVGRRLCRTRS